MSESIYDKLNYATGSDDCDELIDAINDAKDDISGIDDKLNIISSGIKKLIGEFEERTINEIKEFLKDIESEIDEQSAKLY